MRVLFDGFWWMSGSPSGKLVLRELVQAWSSTFPRDQIVLAVRRSELDVIDNLPDGVVLDSVHLWPQALSAAVEMPFLARKHAVDITVAQNYTPRFGPSAVFIHDVLFLTNPEWFTATERVYFRPMTWLARRARVVFTSSVTEAERIRTQSRKLRPIPVGLAVASSLRSVTSEAPPNIDNGLPYVLSVGRLNVRKNLAVTIRAAVLSDKISKRCPLIVVGEAQGKHADWPADVQQAIDDGTVRLLGHVSDASLKWLYERAQLFVFLSLAEGFGLPPLEAEAFSCPVLVSDLPIFRETMGTRATFVDPTDTVAIAAHFDHLLAQRRPEQHGHPIRKVSEYNWSVTVDKMRAAILAEGVSP